MKINIKGIDAEMTRLRKAFNKERERLLFNKALDISRALAIRTPIDTGLASESWSTVEMGSKTLIVNPVPYIDRLNEGSSRQAPEHFVEEVLLGFGKPVGTLVTTTTN